MFKNNPAGITDNVEINLKTVDESPNYNKLNADGENWTGIVMKKAIVVNKGMQSGMPSFDLQFEDEKGNKYVAMVTGNIMKNIAVFARK